MASLDCVVDALRRRCRFFMKNDNIDKIYVTLDDKSEEVHVTLILSEEVSKDTLISYAIRYERTFADLSYYTFRFLNPNDYFQSNKDNCYVVWKKNCGFIGESIIRKA